MDIKILLRERLQLEVESVRELVGFQDRNFMITASGGRKCLLKLSRGEGDREFIQAQNRLLRHLAGHAALRNLLPEPVSLIDGGFDYRVQIDDQTYTARLLTWLEGRPLAECSPDESFPAGLGRFFAQLDMALSDYQDPVLQVRSHDWDLARVAELSEYQDLIADSADRRLVRYYLMKYREEVLPSYHKLPRQLIHGDGNDYNLLVGDDGKLAGLIDFGDLVWSARIHEMAVALAYLMMNRSDFHEVRDSFVAGYSSRLPLTPEESRLLHWLIPARWCQTLLHAARNSHERPGSEYHQVSVAAARDMLRRWIKIDNPDVKPEIDREVLLKNRKNYFTSNLSLSYREPIHMAGAAFQYMYGADGKTYVDCVNNIPHVGHCHPRVVEAGQRQMARINTNTRYLYESLDRYAAKLLGKFPPSLNRIFMVNSGSAATDLAVRLAEAHTGRKEMLVLDHAYHGNTRSAIALSPYKFNRKGGAGRPESTEIIPLGVYESRKAGGQEGRRERIKDSKIEIEREGKPVGAFFAESIPGCAGQVMLSAEFMLQQVKWVREQGGLYVADEVQTGFGRVGSHFWGFELYGLVPDIVILGKPMGNGHPMGAVVCSEEVARSFETGMEFFSSFGGNPVSCEIGLAVLEVIEEENLQQNALEVGNFILETFKSSCIADIRGSGLFLGIELVKDLTSREPDGESASRIVNRMKERGFLLSTDGPYENVIKFKPPMCFSMENAREMMEELGEAIG